MKGLHLIDPAHWSTAAQMANVGAAAELLLEAMVEASKHPTVTPASWYDIKLSIRKNPDGSVLLGNCSITEQPW